MPFTVNVVVVVHFSGSVSDAVTWEDFINKTTIHGVSYVFNKGLLIRRLFHVTF